MESFLIVQRGDEIGRRVDLNADQITVGRGSDNDVILNDPMVSRYHAVLKRQGEQYGVIDLGSSNPVVVNDQGLDPGVARQLAHRDVLLIGRNVFSFQQRSGTTSLGQSAVPAQRPATTPPAIATVAPTMVEHDSNLTASNDDRTMITPYQGANTQMADNDKTMSGAGMADHDDMMSGAEAQDHDKTIIGGGMETPPPPPPPHFAPPPAPTAVHFDDDAPTNVGWAAPQGDRMIGTPPDEEDGDLPTQIIPRR